MKFHRQTTQDKTLGYGKHLHAPVVPDPRIVTWVSTMDLLYVINQESVLLIVNKHFLYHANDLKDV
jgi:hypothetical protein